MTNVTLIGYSPSVYSRTVRLALMAADVPFAWVEVDPFEAEGGAAEHHPFARVPVLRHGDIRLYETAAILTYINAVFGTGPSPAPMVQARAVQVGAIADNYVYRPLVRQVFVEGVLAPRDGRAPNAARLEGGMARAPAALDALDEIAAEGLVLTPGAQGRADWHLGPMIDLFARYEPARAALAARPALMRWFRSLETLPLFVETAPDRMEPI